MQESLRLLTAFGENLALLLALGVLYTLFGLPWLRRAGRSGAVGMGAIFGTIAIAGIQAGIELAPGVFFDGRNIVVMAAAAFGGPWAGLAAAGIAGAYRLWLGGAGTVAGLGGVASAALLGTWLYLRWWRRGGTAGFGDFALGGLLLAVVTLLWLWAVPEIGARLVAEVAVPLLLLYPTGFPLLALLLSSEQRQAAAMDAARRSERRFRDVAEAASDWFWETGPDLRLTYLSDRFQAATGIDPGTVLGRRREDLADRSADEASWPKHLADLRARRPFRDFSYDMARPGGGVRRVNVSGRPVTGDDGRFQGYRGTATDITAEVETARRMRSLEAQLIDAIESMSDAFVLFDADDRLVLCNERYRDLNPLLADLIAPGARFEDLARRSARDQIRHEAADDEAAWLAARLASHRNPPSTRVHQRRDGPWLQVAERRTQEGGTLVVIADITETKRREGALEADSILLQATLDSISHGLSVVDAGSRLIAWNRRFVELFELPPERLRKGMGWAELGAVMAERGENNARDPDWLPGGGVHDERTGGMQRYEKRRGGMVIRARRNPMPGGGFTATYSDITDARQHEARLAELAQRNASLAAAVAAASTSMVVTDPNLPGNPIILVNPAFTRITGYEAAEAIGRNCRFLQGKDTDPDTIERLRRAIVARRPINVTIRNYRKDGRTFWSELSVSPVFDERRQLIHFVGIQTDVTGRVRAEDALRRSERDLRELAQTHAATLDALPAYVALLDPAGAVVSVNKIWRESTRFVAAGDAADIGGNYLALLDDTAGPFAAEAPEMSDGLRAVLAGASDLFTHEYPDGAGPERRWLQFIATPVAKDGGRGAVVMHLDITNRVRAEDELRAAMEQAEYANRSKSEFLANVSHELRTPLNAVIGFSEILHQEMFGPIGKVRYKEYARDIHASGVHLLSIINDILDLSKIEAGKFDLHESELDLSAVVAACVTLVRERAREGKLALRTELAAALPPLRADERAVKQILINLLSNAVKFTPAGGAVTVRARMDDAGHFLLSVTDTGIGIAEKDMAKAMAAFSQVDNTVTRKFAGTGLGLPLVRLLAGLHGGEMSLESEVGVGTTVTVRLPQRRAVMAA